MCRCGIFEFVLGYAYILHTKTQTFGCVIEFFGSHTSVQVIETRIFFECGLRVVHKVHKVQLDQLVQLVLCDQDSVPDVQNRKCPYL
jgi:hypothetical protein